MNDKLKKLRTIATIALYVLLCGLIILAISMKIDYHVDEYFTYTLSNTYFYEEQKAIKNTGGSYYDAKEFFAKITTVDDGNRFNYKMVWENQAKDVHPPLYYCLVHTVCSLFPGVFSRWFAGIINVIFGLLSLYVLRKLAFNLTQSEEFKLIASIGFILSACILSEMTMLRMYIVALFCVSFVTNLLVEQMDKGANAKFYCLLFSVTLLGALTHYYFLVYLAILSATYCLYLLHMKRIRGMFTYVAVMACDAACALLLFPQMLNHMFAGYRGKQVLDNLTQASDFKERLSFFYALLDKKLMGGLLSIILIATLIGVFFLRASEKRGRVKKTAQYLIIALSLALYFLWVTKSAVMLTNRYMVPAMGVFFITILAFVYTVGAEIAGKEKSLIFLCVVVAAISLGSIKNTSWNYLFLQRAQVIADEEQYYDNDYILMYDEYWKTLIALTEESKYKKVALLNTYESGALCETIGDRNNVMVKIICDDESMADRLIEKALGQAQNVNKYTQIETVGRGYLYYLYQ